MTTTRSLPSSAAGQETPSSTAPIPPDPDLAWKAALAETNGETAVIVTITSPIERAAQTSITVGPGTFALAKFDTYRSASRIVGAVHLDAADVVDRPAETGIQATICFVCVYPRLEHLLTLIVEENSVIGDSKWALDFRGFYFGDPIDTRQFQILEGPEGAFAVLDHTRRLPESDMIVPIGKQLYSLGQPNWSPPTPPWLSVRLAETIPTLGFGPFGKPSPFVTVDSPAAVEAAVFAAPERIFPPLNFVLFLSVDGRPASGLFSRDLSPRSSTDRKTKDSLSQRLAVATESQPPNHRVFKSRRWNAPFQWSAEARRVFGVPRMTVVAQSPTRLIGTLERTCAAVPPDVGLPDRELWVFTIDWTGEGPAPISADLVDSCVLRPFLSYQSKPFLYRTNGRGQIEQIASERGVAGLRASFSAPQVFGFDGAWKPLHTEELPSINKEWVEFLEEAKEIDRGPIEHQYTLETP